MFLKSLWALFFLFPHETGVRRLHFEDPDPYTNIE